MRAKEYVLRARRLDRLIENKMAERAQWFAMATSTTAPFAPETGVRVQTSGGKQNMENAIVRYIEIEREMDDAIKSLVEEKQQIIRTLEMLNTAEYDVLHQLYIQGKTLQEVADKRGCSYSNITTIHGRALQSLQKILDGAEGCKKKIKNCKGLQKIAKHCKADL